MARKDKPYLALYIQDFLSDENLRECSPAAVGIHIMTMLRMAKSEQKGTILLQQTDRQTGEKVFDFAVKLAKHLPWTAEEIRTGLHELLLHKCMTIEGDTLYQKRMVHDAAVSDSRSDAGHLGQQALKQNQQQTNKKKRNFAAAKKTANPDIDIESDNDNGNKKKGAKKRSVKFSMQTFTHEWAKDPSFLEAFNGFYDMRMMINKPMTQYAAQLIMTELVKLSSADIPTAIQILQRSIKSKWQDVWPLKTAEDIVKSEQQNSNRTQAAYDAERLKLKK